MGKGLGFQLKKGERVPESKIEKTFRLDSLSQTVKQDYIQLFEDVPEEIISCVQSIIDYANQQYDEKLNKNLFFTLVDHLNYAIERSQKGIVFQNKLLFEIQKYYQKEYAIGCYAIDLINQRLAVHLPLEEAGNIAFHLVNAQDDQTNMEETIQSIRALKDILNLLSYLFPERLNPDSIYYLRFVTHLQFFIMRMLKNETVPNKNDFLLETVKTRFTKEFEAAKKVQRYVEQELGAVVNQDELLYLTLHLSRLS